jgi:hypothetical protein
MLYLDSLNQTKKKTFPCQCTKGHTFSASIYTCIDYNTNQDILNHLCEEGGQKAFCPTCSQELLLFEPILFLISNCSKALFFIPKPLAHRAYFFKTLLQQAILNSTLEEIPEYLLKFDTTIGINYLLKKIPAKSELPEKQPKSDIIDAFADLASIIPGPRYEKNNK